MADHFDFYRVAINYNQGIQPMTNVLHVGREGTDAATVAEDVSHTFAGDLGQLISTDVTWGITTCKEMTSTAIEAVYDMSAETSGHGSEASNPVPPGVAMCITWLTATGGRSGRGRTYLGGVGLAFVNGTSSQWDVVSSDRQDAVDAFITDMLIGDNVLQVYSTLHDTLQPVLSGLARTPFASQRGRNLP